jgi:4-amino-4-deoxy-L-arabinose transferase-like glycosyltransferase
MRSWLRHRLAAADPLTGMVGLVSLVVYLLHGFDKALTRDLGVYTYGGQRFLAGDPPYVGILNRAGPLAHALPGVGSGLGRLVGVGDVHGARAFFMLMSIGSVCLVYVIVRDLRGSRSAALIAAAAFLGFQGFLDLATNGPREKTAMVLFLLVALFAVLHRRWATCGVFIALGTLTWQPVFFVIVVTAVVAAILAPDRRARAMVRIALGGAVTTAVVLLYYAANGAMHTFFEGFVLINAQYTNQPSPFTDGAYIWRSLRNGYGPSLWVILLGLVAVPVLAVTSARTAWRTRGQAAATDVSLGAGWLAGVVWSAIAFNAWPDLFVMLPLAAIGVGGGAAAVLRRLDPRAAVAVTAVLALVGTAYATVFSVTTRGDDLRSERVVIARVLRMGPHPATMLSLQAPEVLVMTHRVNPSPYQMLDSGFSQYVDDTYPGGLAGYVAWIERTAPTYIVMQAGFRPPWLLPWLEEHYAKVGGARQFNFWVSRSVSQDVRQEIRHANNAAMQEAGS